MEQPALAVTNAEKLVAAMMAVRDASHDAAHTFRVQVLTLSLAKEKVLAALLHDIGDYKYTKDGTEDTKVVQKFLEEASMSGKFTTPMKRKAVPQMRDGEDYKASFVGDPIHEDEARKCCPERYQKKEAVFDDFPDQRDVVSWNAIIAGYARCGRMDVTDKLFDRIPLRDIIS